MAEVSTKVIQGMGPAVPSGGSSARRIAFIRGVSAANGDTITVPEFTTVEGAFLISTTGTVITMTFATNVITLTNGGTLTVTGIAWGN